MAHIACVHGKCENSFIVYVFKPQRLTTYANDSGLKYLIQRISQPEGMKFITYHCQFRKNMSKHLNGSFSITSEPCDGQWTRIVWYLMVHMLPNASRVNILAMWGYLLAFIFIKPNILHDGKQQLLGGFMLQEIITFYRTDSFQEYMSKTIQVSRSGQCGFTAISQMVGRSGVLQWRHVLVCLCKLLITAEERDNTVWHHCGRLNSDTEIVAIRMIESI